MTLEEFVSDISFLPDAYGDYKVIISCCTQFMKTKLVSAEINFQEKTIKLNFEAYTE